MPLIPWQITVELLLSRFTLISPACQALRKNSHTVPMHCKQIGDHFILIPHYLRLVWKKMLTSLNAILVQSNFVNIYWSIGTIYVCNFFLIFCQKALSRTPTSCPQLVQPIGFSAERWTQRFIECVWKRVRKCWPYHLIAPFPFHSPRDVKSVELISVV